MTKRISESPAPSGGDELAIELMNRFAERTGLTTPHAGKRYLWTDAFAVCNLLGLARTTGSASFMELACSLVDRVHHTLGRHRPDDPRNGWLSGLSDADGELHPTRGGLRIGKSLPERTAAEPYEPRLEWDRDGQYFHYLTKWMHALDQVARARAEPRFNRWARELAVVSHASFRTTLADGHNGLVWKMSVDLSRPLVASMGQHDPLDGFITSAQLQATASEFSWDGDGPSLARELASFSTMLERSSLVTADPLGVGGLFVSAYRLFQLQRNGAAIDERLLARLLSAGAAGLEMWSAHGDPLSQPAARRLAFRELGLAIGLSALGFVASEAADWARDSEQRRGVLDITDALGPHAKLGRHIESFWRAPENQATRAWNEHEDINEVMLATAIAPDGFLRLGSPIDCPVAADLP